MRAEGYFIILLGVIGAGLIGGAHLAGLAMLIAAVFTMIVIIS